MERTLATLSTKEFEELVEHTIDKRLEVWLAQLTDALTSLQDEGKAELQSEFTASLNRSLEQARSGESVTLKTFREQLGR